MAKRIVKSVKNIAVKITASLTKRADRHRVNNPDAIKPTDATNASGVTNMRIGRYSGMRVADFQNDMFTCIANGDRITDAMFAQYCTVEFPTSAVVVGTSAKNPIANSFPVGYITSMRRDFNMGRHGNAVPVKFSPRCITDVKSGLVVVDPKWSHKTDTK